MTTEHTESEVEVRANYDMNFDFKQAIDRSDQLVVLEGEEESGENEKEPETTVPFA